MIALAALLTASALLAAWRTTSRGHALRIDDVVSRLHSLVRRRPGSAARLRNAMRDRARESTGELAAELRAGQPLGTALRRSYADELAPRARAAVTYGGSVSEALRADATAPGAELLASVAACWQVAEGNGAGLAAALDRLVAQDRAAGEVRSQLAAHLAAPRATSRMLATLPIIGIGLGFALGVDPLGWLLGSWIGWSCLLLGAALAGIGLWWTSRITARVERLL